MNPNDLYIVALQKKRLSATRPRKIVFTTLMNSGLISMRQLIALCDTVDRASIYRAVAVFEEAGILHKVPRGFAYGIELSDTFIEHHHHMTCSECGSSEKLSAAKLEMVMHDVAAQHGFKMTSHSIEVQGICIRCRSKNGD